MQGTNLQQNSLSNFWSECKTTTFPIGSLARPSFSKITKKANCLNGWEHVKKVLVEIIIINCGIRVTVEF